MCYNHKNKKIIKKEGKGQWQSKSRYLGWELSVPVF